MLGAIAGDIIGSIYENWRIKRKDFRLFTPFSTYTDDTVLTIAVADALMHGTDFGVTIKRYARRRPFRGYGPRFYRWMFSPGMTPYNSFGNGSAMRVSSVAYAAQSSQEVLQLAAKTAECTHNHPAGIQGAQAAALCVFMARMGETKESIRETVSGKFGYDLTRSIEAIRPGYRRSFACAASVPEAIIAFLDSRDFEDALRNAVSLGGDADTQAAIAGSIAEAFYGGVPLAIARRAWHKLPQPYRDVIARFHRTYVLPTNISELARDAEGGK